MTDMQPYEQPVAPPPSVRPTPPPAGPPQPIYSTYAEPAPSPLAVPNSSLVVTDQRPTNGVVLAIAWTSAILTLGYMLPWAIAATRGKSNQAAVGVINLLLGWTLVGWVIALVMACQAHTPAGIHQPAVAHQTTMVLSQSFGSVPTATAAPNAAADWYPAPDGDGIQYWDGNNWTDHRTA